FEKAQKRNDSGQERYRAFERLLFLMNAIPFEKYPRLASEIMRVTASCAHELGLDAKTQAGFDEVYGKSSSKMALALQGAMLEGMERLDEALIVHLRRTRLFPKSSDACVDAASVLRQRALRERGLEQGDRARRDLRSAVLLHDQALLRAVRAGDEDETAFVLIERARCLLDLEEPAARVAAEASLREALAHDAARLDARVLLEACKLEAEPDLDPLPQELQPKPATHAEQPAVVADAPPPAEPGPKTQKPLGKGLLGIPLVDRVQSSLELDKADLANAGKNLTSIYRGLRDVLKTAAGAAPAATPSGVSPQPASGPVDKQQP
ncbi:MAG TPA: hypothetical protein VM509_08545, partial [Planctomycetota bacterium]|nr:hypothetical protein [Planctomycetota bacterium]